MSLNMWQTREIMAARFVFCTAESRFRRQTVKEFEVFPYLGPPKRARYFYGGK